MKNLLILIVAIALFLHFYPQKELTELYEQSKEKILTTFSDATDTRVRLNSKKVKKDLEKYQKQFNEQEQNYINEITRPRKSVVNFYREYCETSKRTAKLHLSNQKLVCDAIIPYQSLF